MVTSVGLSPQVQARRRTMLLRTVSVRPPLVKLSVRVALSLW